MNFKRLIAGIVAIGILALVSGETAFAKINYFPKKKIHRIEKIQKKYISKRTTRFAFNVMNATNANQILILSYK